MPWLPGTRAGLWFMLVAPRPPIRQMSTHQTDGQAEPHVAEAGTSQAWDLELEQGAMSHSVEPSTFTLPPALSSDSLLQNSSSTHHLGLLLGLPVRTCEALLTRGFSISSSRFTPYLCAEAEVRQGPEQGYPRSVPVQESSCRWHQEA